MQDQVAIKNMQDQTKMDTAIGVIVMSLPWSFTAVLVTVVVSDGSSMASWNSWESVTCRQWNVEWVVALTLNGMALIGALSLTLRNLTRS